MQLWRWKILNCYLQSLWEAVHLRTISFQIELCSILYFKLMIKTARGPQVSTNRALAYSMLPCLSIYRDLCRDERSVSHYCFNDLLLLIKMPHLFPSHLYDFRLQKFHWTSKERTFPLLNNGLKCSRQRRGTKQK